jgi:hypothetical protein
MRLLLAMKLVVMPSSLGARILWGSGSSISLHYHPKPRIPGRLIAREDDETETSLTVQASDIVKFHII